MDYIMDVGHHFWLVAAAAELAEPAEGGFGFQFDLLESNIINLAIVIGVVVYFGKGFLSKTLGDRKATIATAIQEAEQRKKQAAEALALEQQKLAQAQQEAQRIRAASQTNASAAKAEILAKAAQEIERIRAAAAQDGSASQDRVVRELQQQTVAKALQQVERELQSRLSNDDAQRALVDRSIALLG
jgi:F-type H+-transporting ATPase subunit b